MDTIRTSLIIFILTSSFVSSFDSPEDPDLTNEWNTQLGSEMTLQLFKVFEKKIEKLEKSDKNLRASIGTLISTNIQLRFEMEEMTNKYSDLEQQLDDKTERLSSKISSLLDTQNGKKGESKADSEESCEKMTSNEKEEDNLGDVQEYKNDDLNTKKKAKSSSPVYPAFTAYLDTSVTPTAKDSTIVYNKVLLNEGGNYDKKTGLFTAETAGLYLFSWSASVTKDESNKKNNQSVLLRLMINDEYVVSSVTDSADMQSCSVAVVKLSRGDTVWISTDTTSTTGDIVINGDGNKRTASFTGVLIHHGEE